MGDRGWARQLLTWSWRGALLVSEISTARYFVRCERCETTAWAELRDPSGRRRIEIGSFRSVTLARAACERDAVARCRREREERAPVDAVLRPSKDVRISPNRRRAGKADKGRELPAPNYRPRESVAALDDALRAFADVVADCD